MRNRSLAVFLFPRAHVRGLALRGLTVLILLAGSAVGCSDNSVFTQPTSPVDSGPSGSELTVTSPTATSTSTSTSSSTSTSTTSPTTTTTTTIPEHVSAAGTWTVMVYALLDNNLDDWWQFQDFVEMRAVSREVPGLVFLTLLDRSDGYYSEELGRLGDWTTAKLIEISGGQFTEINDWGESDLGRPSTLVAFLEAAAAHTPADHYALVVKDHGGGMLVGPDEVPGNNVLWNSELAEALAQGLGASGIGALDLIAFDTCLMASLETASAVHPFAAYMIASEDISYSGAFYYSGFDYLGAAAGPTLDGLGETLLSHHIEFMMEEVEWEGGTLSLLDLRRFPAFEDALTEAVEVAVDTMSASAPVFGRRLERVIRFGADPDPTRDFGMVDLGQLLQRVSRSDAPAAAAAGRAANLLREMVVANVTGDAARGARGLSVFFPPTPSGAWLEWGDGANLYDDEGSPVWNSFLEAYFATGRAIPPERRPTLSAQGAEAEYAFDEFGINVAAQFDPATVEAVVSAVLWSGVVEPDGAVTFYEASQGFQGDDPAEGIFFGVYDLTRIVLSDGEDSAFGFSQITFNEDATFFTLTVPLLYRAPVDPAAGLYGDPIELALIATYDAETGKNNKGLFVTNDGTVGPFTPDPRGLLYAKVARRSPGGEMEWMPSSEVGLWADMDNLVVDYADLPSGARLRSELTVSDYGDHRATAGVSVTIP